MKNLPKVLLGIALLAIAAAVIGKILGQKLIGFGSILATPVSVLVFANSLMLITLLIKQK